MTKKLRLQRGGGYFNYLPDGGGGYFNCFENLPDELVILIFTKLSSSSSGFLDAIKSLGRCSAVSKRFDALTCLVPTLSLRHPDIDTLYKCCPKILKKFNHIRSLQVTHSFTPSQPLPFIFWEAAYRPHSYRLSFVSFKKCSHYIDDPQKQQSLMDAAKDDDFFKLTKHHIANMIYLHHMLVSSIKDHIYLQRVVVSDFNHRGTLTLEDDMLVELRNCTSPKYDKKGFWVRDGSGFVINLDVPSLKPRSGVVINNFYFSNFEWDTESHEDEDDYDDDDGLPQLKYQGVNLSKVLKSVSADDVKKIEEIAHSHGALLMVDIGQQHDVPCAGTTLGAWSRLGKELYFLQNAEGAGLAPFDCWICLRGVQTMALRFEKQQVH